MARSCLGQVVLIGALLVLVSLKSCEGFIKVAVEGENAGQLIDEYGRVRIFHGVNVVYKEFPWHPSNGSFDSQLSLNSEDIQNLVDWGFNFVRLGVMWPGVEPSPGVINQTYLQVMNDFVNSLYDAGIYSLVDFHQDLLSRFTCGEGIPDWAYENQTDVLPFPLPALAQPLPLDPNGYPNLTDCLSHSFGRYYPSEAVGAQFSTLYDPTSNLQNAFVNYWSNVSLAFKDSQGVIGYELINEPWAGNIEEDPELLLPGVADKKNLAPLYERLNTVIREHDDEHIIFYERALTDIFGAIGFESGPGGPAFRDRQVYSYHIYCAAANSSGDPRNLRNCLLTDSIFWLADDLDWKRLGGGAFMTEFGAVDDADIAINMLGSLTDTADALINSWAYWSFKLYHDITTVSQKEGFYDGEGNLEIPKVKALSRTYPQAVAGQILGYRFHADSGSFTFEFKLNTTIKAPTELYLNEALWYPNGYTVDVNPSDAVEWSSPQTNAIEIVPSSSAIDGTEVQVNITPN